MEQNLYTPNFYRFHQEGSTQSARAIVPLILELIRPSSVVDVGCGTGTWLVVFQEHGVQDYQGIDGSYVDPSQLQIPAQHFRACDLKQPLSLGRQFDLALCLEVAEHLPQQSAGSLVESLTHLSPVVFFGAAIPFQGGDGHINEQWQDYWAQQFQGWGYLAIDALRAKLWDNPKVKAWYAQNSLFFVQKDRLETYPALVQAAQSQPPTPINLVHPQTYTRVVTWLQSNWQLAQQQYTQVKNATIAALPAETNPLEVNPHALLTLYLQQAWDRLTEKFLRLFQHFETATYTSLSVSEQYAIDSFIHLFLFLFTQSDYVVSDAYAIPLIQHNAVIANLVAISSLKNTDSYLSILGNQSQNLVKVLTLYSARNTLRIDRQLFFDANPQLASIWYCQFYRIYHSTCVNPASYQHLKEHLAYVDPRITQVSQFHHVCFAATYIDPKLDRGIKQQINHTLKQQCAQANLQIKNTPNPRRIAVITNTWHRGHSVYRNQCHFLKALQEDYDLVLIHLGPVLPDLDISMFKEIRYMQLVNDFLAIDTIKENDFGMVYFPDVGMNMESIILSNLRIAPVQVTSYGHSVSTFGAEIDYFIGSADVEIPEQVEQNYSERLVLIPGLGITNTKPNYVMKNAPKTSGKIIINCSWYPQKMNYPLMEILQEILRKSQIKPMFRFFCGGGLVEANHFVPFIRDISAIFGAEAQDTIEVVQGLSYEHYMTLMEMGDFCLDSYHFGGCNTVVDSLYLGKPIVTFPGQHWYNRIGSQMLRLIGLEELIATNRQEYINLTLKLIHEPDYRAALQAKIQHLNLDETIFNVEHSRYFKQAIDVIMTHPAQLSQDDRKQPIVISP
jgi:predicted O-linked N-acetylglucosamine transferase (SPINDLY family)/SAM-dependent methyltransferase